MLELQASALSRMELRATEIAELAVLCDERRLYRGQTTSLSQSSCDTKAGVGCCNSIGYGSVMICSGLALGVAGAAGAGCNSRLVGWSGGVAAAGGGATGSFAMSAHSCWIASSSSGGALV